MELKTDLLKSILESVPYGISFIDRDKKIVFWNKGAELITGFNRLEMLKCRFNLFGDKNCIVNATAKQKVHFKFNTKIKRKDGNEVSVFAKTSPLFDQKGIFEGVILTLSNNSFKSEMKEKIKALETIASYDFLTSLHNRRIIEKVLYERLNELIRAGKSFGVLFIDIDYFKKINDIHGHEVGDAVLKMVSEKLSTTLRPFDFLGRWGGEEFVAVISHVDRQELYSVADRFRELVEKASFFNGKEVIKVTISIGAAFAKKNDSIVTLLKRADEMMYKSKEAGRNKVSVEKII